VVCDTPAVTGAGLRVLVVEDDHRIASMIAKGLGAKGHAAEIVSTGGEALEYVAAGATDVMLLDLGLPDIDGLDVLRRLAADGHSIPVIVITARSDPTDREAAVELGVAAYLTKPFAWSDVWAVIETCGSLRG
jgi:two-component system, OmpR family, response regulator